MAVDPVAHMDGLGGVGIRNEIWIIPNRGLRGRQEARRKDLLRPELPWQALDP